VLLAGLVLGLGLAAFGARTHWVEEVGSAERDGYVAQAERLLAGEAPRDPFRPPLCTYAVAALTPAIGDAFAAARLIANLSAAALALLAFGFARRLAAGENAVAAGLWAFALVALNPNTWILGQHTTTDMPFAALAGTALLAALAYLERPRFATAAIAALAWALAAMTRGNAALLLPGLIAAWWMAAPLAGPRSRRQRLTHLAAAVGLACLVMLPHWILRARTFGTPFYDENWKNLAWKLDGYPDWSRLDTIPATGSFAFVLSGHPGDVARGAASELWRFVATGATQLFGTWAHALAFAAGAVLCWRARPRQTAWLIGTSLIFLVGIATAFFAWGRLILVLLPIGAALGAAGATHVPQLAVERRRLVTVGLALLALLLAVKTAGFRLPAFVLHHPTEDVATLRRLEATLARGLPLAGTSPFLDRYLTHPYVAIPDAFGEETRNGSAYLDRLVTTLRGRRVAYLVIGSADLRDRPVALLGLGDAPNGLALVERTPRLTVWKVLPK